MANTFPETIYVKSERDGATEYFVADDKAFNLVEMGERIKVATYKLVEIQTAEGVASFKKAR